MDVKQHVYLFTYYDHQGSRKKTKKKPRSVRIHELGPQNQPLDFNSVREIYSLKYFFVILILMYAFTVLVLFLIVKRILMLIMYSAASL